MPKPKTKRRERPNKNSFWPIRRLGEHPNCFVSTFIMQQAEIVDLGGDYIFIAGPTCGEGTLVLHRKAALILARRIKQCLDATRLK
jgi:hypothetical protein